MKKVDKLYAVVMVCLFICLSGCDWGNKQIYSGQVSGVNGGAIIADNLAINFPRGIANTNISISIESGTETPSIKGTEQQLEAYKHFRFIGPIYKIKASQKQFNIPYILTLRFDPAEFGKLRAGEILKVVSISDDGKLEFIETVFDNSQSGLITVRSKHFCNMCVIAATPEFARKFSSFVAQYRYGEQSPYIPKNQPQKLPLPPPTYTPEEKKKWNEQEARRIREEYTTELKKQVAKDKINATAQAYLKAKDNYYNALKEGGDKKHIDELYKIYQEAYQKYIQLTNLNDPNASKPQKNLPRGESITIGGGG